MNKYAAATLALPLGLLDFARECEVENAWARYSARNPDFEYTPKMPNPFRCIADMYELIVD